MLEYPFVRLSLVLADKTKCSSSRKQANMIGQNFPVIEITQGFPYAEQ